MHINDRSNIARAQLMLWNIDEQHDLRKSFYHLLVPFSGYAVTRSGYGSPMS